MPKRKRNVFYSFHYDRDFWRAAQVRNIGAVEGNKSASDNDWETITEAGDAAIKKWINEQMEGRSCVIVLVGTQTAKRPWIDYEIEEAWNSGKGVVGIHVHGLKNKDKYTSKKGNNPFAHFTLEDGTVSLSSVVKCYNPSGSNSKERYAWISKNLEAAIEEAIRIRNNY